jgi:hypothetical protein
MIAFIKNHVLAARSTQTQSVKGDIIMGKMLNNLGVSILEIFQGLGVGITAGAALA